ncbi:MAG: PEP-CTERM sorting domain-containing protein [Verrucomicrobiaceae bacterium]
MKLPISFLTALVATSLSASAFSVDFTGNLGTIIQNPAGLGQQDHIELPVPGYGSVTIFANLNKTLEIAQSFSNDGSPITSLEFNNTDSITVRFNGPTAINVDFDYVGVSFGDDFDLSAAGAPPLQTDYILDFDSANAAGSSGLRAISWDAVPEPSSALLLGFAGFTLLRRRR